MRVAGGLGCPSTGLTKWREKMKKFFGEKDYEYEVYKQGGGVISWDYPGGFPVVDCRGNAIYERDVEECDNVMLLDGFKI
jgi:hypothetical protein